MPELEQVEEIDIKKNPKRSKLLQFHFDNLDVDSFKIVGKWFSIKDTQKEIASSVIGSVILGKQETNKKGDMCQCAQKYIIAAKKHQRHVLILEATAYLNGRKNNEKLLTHLTGFDSPSIINNLNIDSNLPFIHSTINKR